MYSCSGFVQSSQNYKILELFTVLDTKHQEKKMHIHNKNMSHSSSGVQDSLPSAQQKEKVNGNACFFSAENHVVVDFDYKISNAV